jgi:NOL1/NOP2/fmu family ribosome biogenesis protein
MQVKKVNAKEVEELIKENYGSEISLESFNVFIRKDQKVFLASKGLPVSLIEKSDYLLHFGTIKRNRKIQLSVEGSQLVGKTAKKNIVILDEENVSKFVEGLYAKPKELVDCSIGNFVLVKHGNDFFGSGVLREGYIEGYIPKERRIMKEMKKI